MPWHPYENEKTIGKEDSENGVIVAIENGMAFVPKPCKNAFFSQRCWED
jgi:hypothetical protein